MEGHRANDFGGEFDLENVTEGFFEEENSLSVVRPMGPLPEPGHLCNVWRQMIGWALAAVFGGNSDSREGRNDPEEKEPFHNESEFRWPSGGDWLITSPRRPGAGNRL